MLPVGLGRNTLLLLNCLLPTLLNGQEQKESLLSVTYLSEKQKEKTGQKKAEPNGLGLWLATKKEVHFAFNTLPSFRSVSELSNNTTTMKALSHYYILQEMRKIWR